MNITYGGGGTLGTAVSWPTDFTTYPVGVIMDNALFNITPNLPVVNDLNTSGATSSTLTAPVASGNYTIRVYAASAFQTFPRGVPRVKLETDFKDIAVTVLEALSISSFTPPSPVSDHTAGAARTYSISIDQTVNVSWYINGNIVQTNTSVASASYTNTSASRGTWNVSAIANNANGSAMQTWNWNVIAMYPYACDFCHNYPPVQVNISTDISSISLNPGQPFTVNITYGGGGTLGTAVSWPTDFTTYPVGVLRDNALFNITPNQPVNGLNTTGTTSSTLTAPVAPGNYTIRVYAATAFQTFPSGVPLVKLETDFKDIAVTILGATDSQTTEPLVSGYNLIPLSLMPDPPIYASNLLYTATGGIPGVTKVVRWNPNTQQWEGYEYIVADGIYLGNNFALEENKAYFIKGDASTAGQTYTFVGRR